MSKAGGEEVWPCVPEEEGDGEDRQVWILEQRPVEGCTPASFKKAGIFSYESLETAIEYCILHLTKSGHHLMSHDDATVAATSANFVMMKETVEERVEYSRQATKSTTKKRGLCTS